MPFTGAFANSEGPVGAGLDTILIVDGVVIVYATDVTIDQDFELEGIRTLGYHGDRFFKSMGYTANLSVGTYVLREGDVDGALPTAGWQADGTFNLNTAGESDWVMADVDTLRVLVTCLGTKQATENIQFPTRGLNTKGTTWRASRVLPGLETS